jgi:hypothetical protein
MEPIRVSADFNKDGMLTPRIFTWKGRQYTIDSIGRRWWDENGNHILVMIPGGRVFELLFVPAEECWYLARPDARRMFA